MRVYTNVFKKSDLAYKQGNDGTSHLFKRVVEPGTVRVGIKEGKNGIVFGDPAAYNTMFGPDKCGYTRGDLNVNYKGTCGWLIGSSQSSASSSSCFSLARHRGEVR